jgi:hypothetical protein
MLLDTVQEYLRLNAENVTKEEALRLVPPGWKHLVEKMFLFLELYQPDTVTLDKLFIDQHSLLRMSALDKRSPHGYIERVAQSLAGESARHCMITGEYGYRRKKAPGRPSLNNSLYVEYMNEAAQRGLLE